MDYSEMKQQAVDEIRNEIFSLLRKVEPQVIAAITESVKSEYE